MPYLRDPDGRQSAEISKITDFRDKCVLEIGCGDGTLTWGYASQAASITVPLEEKTPATLPSTQLVIPIQRPKASLRAYTHRTF